MILEGIVTTELENGGMHVAPMGPWVQPDLTDWVLKPFQTSTTFANLRRTNRCIFHVVDDVELLVKGVLGVANDAPATWIEDHGYCLNESCHWYALKMDHWDISEPRAVASASIQFQQVLRPFFGWNRAKHAVLEGAILASRLQWIDEVTLRTEFDRLRPLVQKTAGPKEHAGFQMLEDHMERYWAKTRADSQAEVE